MFGRLPRIGPAMKWVMITLSVIWAGLAAAIEWGGASANIFFGLCGNASEIAHGQVWRLFTAPFVHTPNEFGPILFSVLGVYFIGSSLEARWGSRRFVRFLLFSGWLAYAIQFILLLILPDGLTSRLVGLDGYWSGAFPVVEAAAMAWALSFRGQQARFGSQPVSTKFLVWFVVGVTVVWVGIGLAGGRPPNEGVISPIAGLFAGWFFGGGKPSPARRLLLKYRLGRLEKEQKRHATERKRRVARSGLEVIPGGKSDEKRRRDPARDGARDEDGTSRKRGNGNGNGNGSPPDGTLLN